MAGAVRQPIDLDSLTAYLEQNVPEVKLPFGIKQVSRPCALSVPSSHSSSLASVNQIQRIN